MGANQQKLFKNQTNGELYSGEQSKTGRNGYGVCVYSNKDRYEGYWLRNQRHGYGIMYYHSGDLYMGYWVHDVREGYGSYFYMTGKHYEGNWRRDIRHGLGKIFGLRGSRFEGQFEYGKKNGTAAVFDYFGNVSKEVWRRGVMISREKSSANGEGFRWHEILRQAVERMQISDLWHELVRQGFQEHVQIFQDKGLTGLEITQLKHASQAYTSFADYYDFRALLKIAIAEITGPQPEPDCNIIHGVSIDKNIDNQSFQNYKQSKKKQLASYIEKLSLLPVQQFLIHEKIGEGGYANIYKGTWIGIPIAMKIFKKLKNKTDIASFQKETEIISQLRHPNVVLYLGAAMIYNRYCMITEYAESGSLFELLHIKKKRLSQEQQFRIAKGIAWGMAYLHAQNILHRDIKSSNIMLTEGYNVKIGDFGLSKQSWKNKQFPGRVGTTHWMAPEILRCEDYTEAADVYSYGTILWECLTGYIPYKNLSTTQIIGSVGYGGIRLPCNRSPLGRLARSCMSHDEYSRPSFPRIVAKLSHIAKLNPSGNNYEDSFCKRIIKQ